MEVLLRWSEEYLAANLGTVIFIFSARRSTSPLSIRSSARPDVIFAEASRPEQFFSSAKRTSVLANFQSGHASDEKLHACILFSCNIKCKQMDGTNADRGGIRICLDVFGEVAISTMDGCRVNLVTERMPFKTGNNHVTSLSYIQFMGLTLNKNRKGTDVWSDVILKCKARLIKQSGPLNSSLNVSSIFEKNVR
jgi:hypothetical protein